MIEASLSRPLWQTIGGLAELQRRIGMELGAVAPPARTRRIERVVSLRLTSGSINEPSLRGNWGRDRAVGELQGLLMRELDALEYLLPRPIPSVGARGARAPIWAHVRLRFAKSAERDVENYRVVTSKALGDALTGPVHRPDRTLMFRDRPVTGGWLRRDTDRHWLLTMDFDPRLGEPCMTVRLVWDEPDDAGTLY
jgi:hypothetical protein